MKLSGILRWNLERSCIYVNANIIWKRLDTHLILYTYVYYSVFDIFIW